MNPIAAYAIIIKSVPLSILYLIVVGNLLREKVKFNKAVAFVIATLIPSVILLIVNNLNFYTILRIAAIIIGLKIVFECSFKKLMIPFMTSYCLYQLTLNAFATTINSAGLMKAVLTSPLYFNLIFAVLVPGAAIAAAYILTKYFDDLLDLSHIEIINSKIYALFCSMLATIIFISSYLNPYYMGIIGKYNIASPNEVNAFLGILTIIIGMFIFSSLKVYREKHFINVKNQSLDEMIENLRELNKELRAQKHDFFNHLQVASGLLQLRKYNECFDYITNLNTGGQDSHSVRTGIISVNALLNSKQLRAKHKNIKLDFEISSQLDGSTFKIQDWEITRVLGNLIDNAMHEENKFSSTDKYIKVKIDEDNHYYTFSVYNKNSYIGHDKQRSIFTPGYSTKGKDGHGMGLYIVKNIVEKYDGKVDLDSHIGYGTRFSLYIPKGSKSANLKSSENDTSYPPQESLSIQ